MSKPEMIEAGKYVYKDKYIEYDYDDRKWRVFSSTEKVHKIAERDTKGGCVAFVDANDFDITGKPVFVITDDFLAAMEENTEFEFRQAKELFRRVVKDEQSRIKIIFVALIRRKIENLEKIDNYTMKIEEMITKDPTRLSPDQLIEFYEILSRTMTTEVEEIGNFIKSL